VTSDDPPTDAALFRALRRTWERVDPVPADLVDRMVAAVAADDLSREYVLLTLVDGDAFAETRAETRGDADMLTLQFSDGTTNVLIHVTRTESGVRRVDGWVDGAASTVELIQESEDFSAALDGGRFAFDAVPPGVSRLRIGLEPSDRGAEVVTPRFEL
jgi:hypothetical protein